VKTITVTDMKAHLDAHLKASEQGPVIITRNGKPVAVLLAAGDEDELERLMMSHSLKLQKMLDAAKKRMRAGAGIPHEAFWQEVNAENAKKSKKTDSPRKNGRTSTGK
jgi:prevent-host-death family protein